MRIAHLILAHTNPKQLERLLNAMKHPKFYFYIHVDKKQNIDAFEYLLEIQNVFLIKKRTKIYWAGYGTIQATLNGFEEILPEDYDYINVISAQDFPLKNSEFIYNYFKERNGKEFITCESIEDEWSEAAPRVKNYHFINWRIPGKFKMEILANKILPKRTFPLKNFEIVGRANWFSLTQNAAKYIVDFLENHPTIIHYFKYCWGADEFIFSSILYNSPFKKNIVDNLVYVDWSQKLAHPKVLDTSDFEDLKKTEKLFARKFDMSKDVKIFELLEDLIKQ